MRSHLFAIATFILLAALQNGPARVDAQEQDLPLTITYDTIAANTLNKAIVSGNFPLSGSIALYGTDITGKQTLLFETATRYPVKRIEVRFFAARGLTSLEASCVDTSGRPRSGKRNLTALSEPVEGLPPDLVVPAFSPPLLSGRGSSSAPENGNFPDMAAWALHRLMRPRRDLLSIASLLGFMAFAVAAGIAIPRLSNTAKRAYGAAFATIAIAAACVPVVYRPASEAWILEIPAGGVQTGSLPESVLHESEGFRERLYRFAGTRYSGFDFIGIRSPVRSSVSADFFSAYRSVLFAEPPAIELLASGNYVIKAGVSFYAWGVK